MTKQIPVSEAVHIKLQNALKDIEQEFIMMQFKYPVTSDNSWITYKLPMVGSMTVRKSRDAILFAEIQKGIGWFRHLLRYPPMQITTKRTAALRQKFYMLEYQNQNAGCGRRVNWSRKSGKYFAGKFLTGLFDKHISLLERKDGR